MRKKVDDETGADLADDQGVEVIVTVAGVPYVFDFADWDSVAWKKVVNKAQQRGALVALVARDTSLTTVKARHGGVAAAARSGR